MMYCHQQVFKFNSSVENTSSLLEYTSRCCQLVVLNLSLCILFYYQSLHMAYVHYLFYDQVYLYKHNGAEDPL